MRSFRSERRIARTSAIGLRRGPQPPMPMVMPSSSSATTSSMVIRLSRGPLLTCSALSVPANVVAQLVADARQVELEGEALLEPVALVDVDRVDAVERLLGGPDHPGVLGGDLAGDRERGVVELVAGDHLETEPCWTRSAAVMVRPVK